MAHNVLKMKYHPAKKMVEFEALQDGQHFTNYTTSSLYHNYENSPFVLQQHGNTFFETIRTFFNGASSVNLEVTTTRTDYEDLEQMVEFYKRELTHRKINFQINVSLKALLPEMDKVHDNVREYGKDAIGILKRHQMDFHTISSDNKAVQESIAIFSKNLQEEINNIQDKLNRMDDNNVNLCFAGIYSAGKSSLINAILGCRILPESAEPTTARSFRIRSPKCNESIHIGFYSENTHMMLAWDGTATGFSFLKSLADNASARAINELLEKYKQESQHVQIYQVLNYLNADKNVEPVIDVVFPVPLDTENVHFTILDTPGTDSNTLQHGSVLREALKEQESSILIFVAPANHAFDGQGNQDLLDLLENDGKAIDLDRSLFVVNYADCVDSKAREILKNGQIKAKDAQSEDDFQIDLATKKLFFTSAKAAYIAKAAQRGIATEEELFDLDTLYKKAIHDKFGCYYRDNHCATSDYATNRMMSRCQEALKKAEGDQYQELVICAGLFALEDEIVRYGEKYASAVRAHAIIDSVDQALTKVSGKAASLSASTNKSLEQIEAEISRIRSGFTAVIEGQQKKFSLTDKEKLSDDTLQKLHLLSEQFASEVIKPSKSKVEAKMGFFQKVTFSEKQKNDIAQLISEKLAGFEKKYTDGRQSVLSEIASAFTQNVRNEIQHNGGISQAAADYICRIDPPRLPPVEVQKVKTIYDNLRDSDGFWIFKREYLKKNDFLAKLNDFFRETSERTLKSYKNEFRIVLNKLLEETATAYMINLDEYSVLLHAKMIDKQSTEELMRKVDAAANDLRECKHKLDEIIWEAREDET